MKRIYSNKVLLFLFLLSSIFILFNPQPIFADGALIKLDPYTGRWDYHDEKSQQAFINYENGIEKLIISIEFDQSDKNLYWIFPVPSEPNGVSIDIVNTLPKLKGEDIILTSRKNLDNTKNILRKTQLYPLLAELFIGYKFTGSYDTATPSLGGIGSVDFSGGQKDVVIYEHLEKEGITTEVITAVTPLGLAKYFEDKNLNFDGKSMRALTHYIGKDYTFIVSWITNPSGKNQSTQKGVFVSFPTSKIYYPLIPTSVYEYKTIPASIRVIGHVSPVIFENIYRYTEIKYYIDNDPVIDPSLSDFYKNDKNNIFYTLINLNPPSFILTDDLWIKSNTPLNIYVPSFISLHPYLTTAIILVISSFLTGSFTGWSLFKDSRNIKGFLNFGFIGLANCLTIIGLITVVLIRFETKRISFIIHYSVYFLIISWLLVKSIETFIQF